MLSAFHLTVLIEVCLLISLVAFSSILANQSSSARAQADLPTQLNLLNELATPTPTQDSTPTAIVTPTQVVTLTITSTIHPTFTPTPEEPLASPTLTMTQPVELNDSWIPRSDGFWNSYLPNIYVNRIPTTTKLYCSQENSISIPDDDPGGITSDIYVDQPGNVLDVNIFLNINHTWPGDLKASLIHQTSGIRVDIIDRPGVPATSLGCGNARIQAILDDEASQPAENKCGSYPAGIAGIFQPSSPLNQVDRQLTTSMWTLTVSDHAPYDTGNLEEWCLEITSADPSVTPTPTPTPSSLPSSAFIYGVTGKDQALPLDCESRAAVDWAKFFGVSIPEIEFYNRLPHSDNPDKGFVGNVYGAWGNIPPEDYGVHASPIAALLREYGLNARAYHSLRWDDIRAEIASGNPVIVWVTGHAYAGKYPSGAPQYYTSASDMNYTVVANFEHTVIITGYSSSSVTIQDGSSSYNRNLDEFLDSWSSLRNMAILARP